MDRVSFLDSIIGIEYPEMLVGFFDQFLALKQIVEDEGKVVVEKANRYNISFCISFNNKTSLENALKNIPPDSSVVIYNHRYRVSTEILTDKEIRIKIYTSFGVTG